MEWYRDSIWQFVGAIISLFAVFASYNIFKRQRRYKKISFEVISNSALVNVKDEVKSKMQILFDNKPVNDVHLLIVRIINSGNEPIVKSDYETPIDLEFSDKTEVLETDVIHVSPESMKVDIDNDKGVVSIQPLLLNAGDFITIKTLLTNFEGTVKVSGRIAGVKDITRLGLDNSSPSLSSFRFDLFFIYGFSIFGSFTCVGSLIFTIYIKDLFFGIFLMVMGGIVLILMPIYIFITLERMKKMKG